MKAFKAYDIRGVYPEEVNEKLAHQVGKAVATFLDAKYILVGRDVRTSSKSLFDSLVEGIIQTGTNVIDVDICSTPEFYFEIFANKLEGGIMITASHNPKQYNGFKICGPLATPIYEDYGFDEIKEIMKKESYKISSQKGTIQKKEVKKEYTEFLRKYVKPSDKKLKVLFDTGNGLGIREVEVLKDLFGDRLETTVLFGDLDGSFPNHECNPIIEKEMHELIQQLKFGDYDLGLAYDGDADRIVFFSSNGELIPPDMMVPLIAKEYAQTGDNIGFDATSSRIVQEQLSKDGFVPHMYKVGRAFIGEGMKKTDAVFAGEKSGHCFFKELFYTDSSTLAVIQILNVLFSSDKTLNELVKPLMEKYVNESNIHFAVSNKEATIAKVKEAFLDRAETILELDGISIYTQDFFFNLRKSNTEPIIKLTVEGLSQDIVNKIRSEIESLIKSM